MSDDGEQVGLDEVAEEYAEEGDAEEENTDEWMTETLGELAEYQNGNAFSKDEWSDSGYPIIRIQNLTGEQEEYNYFDGELDDQYRVEEGDILLSWSATIDLFEWRGETAALNQHIYRVDTSDDVNDQFFKFKLEDVIPRLVALSHGSTMKHVRKADLVNLDVDLPPLPEQRKIASVLYNVDEAIRKTEEIIEGTKRVKKGVMQDVFTEGYYEYSEYEETYFGPISVDLPQEWEVKNIGRMSETVESGETPTGGSKVYVGSGIPFIRSQNVLMNRLDFSDIAYITEEIHEDMSRSEVTGGDVLLNITGASIGRVAAVPQNIEEANVNQHVCRIRLSEETEVIPSYLSYFLSTQWGQKQVSSFQGGSTREGLNYDQVRSIKLPVPERNEQENIVQTLSKIDEDIGHENKLRDRLKRLKRALMQDLLTGEVRTKDRDIDVLPEVEAHG